MFESIELLGFFATILSSVSSVPQAVRIYRTRNAESVSTGTYIILASSYASWNIYAYHIGAFPLFVGTVFTFSIALGVLGLKFNLWLENNYPKNSLARNLYDWRKALSSIRSSSKSWSTSMTDIPIRS
ncbi:MAG: hypothetical protein GC137_00245 [Alphaproteobacteria bacterium]|nr:hypothetical protein [Alphaproteobacteria bacterium]